MTRYRYVIIPLTLLSLFIFPWSFTVFGMLASSAVFPPSAFMIGIFADVLYYEGQGWLVATIIGALCTLASYGVRHFVKTRIM